MANQYPIIYENLQKKHAKTLEEALEYAGYDASIKRVAGSGFFYYNVYCWGLL
jgi:hypothetical protein